MMAKDQNIASSKGEKGEEVVMEEGGGGGGGGGGSGEEGSEGRGEKPSVPTIALY